MGLLSSTLAVVTRTARSPLQGARIGLADQAMRGIAQDRRRP
jgi:hypothetical protein